MSSHAKADTGVTCTMCGGALTTGYDAEQLRCQYCGHSFLISSSRDVPAYVPAAQPDKRRALAALRRSLREAGVKGHAIEEVRLHYLPFWDVRGKLVGWQRFRRREEAADTGDVTRNMMIERTVEETVSRDVVASLPACDARDFGLLGVAFPAERLRWRSFLMANVEEDSVVCGIVRQRPSALRSARTSHTQKLLPAHTGSPRQRISWMRPRVRLLYYPVWRVCFRLAGEWHRAHVDGVQNRVIEGSGSLRGSDRSRLWLAAGTASGYLAGFHLALGLWALAGWCVHRVFRSGLRGRVREIGGWLSQELSGPKRRMTPLGR